MREQTESVVRSRAVRVSQAGFTHRHQGIPALLLPGVQDGGEAGRAGDDGALHELPHDDEDADGRGPGSLGDARRRHAVQPQGLRGRSAVQFLASLAKVRNLLLVLLYTCEYYRSYEQHVSLLLLALLLGLLTLHRRLFGEILFVPLGSD